MSTEPSEGVAAPGPDGPPDPPSAPPLPPPAPPVEPVEGGAATGADEYVDPHAPMLVGIAFDQPLKAQEFLLAMGRLRGDGDLDLKDAVIVTKTQGGDVKVTETIDPTPGRSAVSGAMWTGLLGLFVGGPVGWLAGIGIGAGAGAVTAKIVDLGIPDEWVDWFKLAVPPGRSAVVILAENVDMRALRREAERFAGAELIQSTLPDGVAADLTAALEG